MWLTCRQVKTIKPLQRMGEGVRWPVESYSPGFTQSLWGEPGQHVAPQPHPRGSSSARRSRGPQPSSLRVTQQGLPEDHFPLTSCVFSLAPSGPSSFYSRPSPELAVRPWLPPVPPSTSFSPAQARGRGKQEGDKRPSGHIRAPSFARPHAQEFSPSPEFPVLTWYAQFWNFPGFLNKSLFRT